jgi:hypothetical protein
MRPFFYADFARDRHKLRSQIMFRDLLFSSTLKKMQARIVIFV